MKKKVLSVIGLYLILILLCSECICGQNVYDKRTESELFLPKNLCTGFIFNENKSDNNIFTIIYEANPYLYANKNVSYTGLGSGSLTMMATGSCSDCGGFLWIRGNVDALNNNTGTMKLLAKNHYLQIDGDLNYKGEATENNANDTTLLITGSTGVDVKGNVTITMDSTGHVAFNSPGGHIHFAKNLVFTQNMRGLNGGTVNSGGNIGYPDANYYGENGFSILAQGRACGTGDCNNRPELGYVWIEGDVQTTNEEHGSTSIRSAHHHILIDGSVRHKGVEGDLNIIAGTSKYDPICDVTCPNTETPLPRYYENDMYGTYQKSTLLDLHKYIPGDIRTAWEEDGRPLSIYPPILPVTGTLDFSHAGRGYIYIAGDVDITMDSIGKARIQSMSDLVQLDGSFKYAGKRGGDLYMDGFYGIGILGNVTTENTAYVDSLQSDYSEKEGGCTVFYTDTGFVEIRGDYRHDAHQANEFEKSRHPEHHWRIGYNFTTPNYQNGFRIAENHGHVKGSFLTFDAYKRIRFHNDVTVCIDSTYGYAKFYARKGFVDFMGTFNFDGTPTATHQGVNPDQGSVSTPGDLLILAYGIHSKGRSSLDTFTTCNPSHGGVVLFQDDAKISFADTGRTIIRSLTGDVMIFKNFTYTNNQTAGVKNENGQFWMQAGQDILGDDTLTGVDALGKTISFIHAGEKSIVMEARGTIHLHQGLLFDRKDAKAGSILLKAGYDYYGDKPFNVANAQNPESLGENWTNAWKIAKANDWCPPDNYENRNGGEEVYDGGDIWFEGSASFDLSQVAAANTSDSVIHTMIGALHTVYIDSTFTYSQSQMNSPGDYVTGYLNVFAHEGNIEAIKDGQIPSSKGTSATSVDITVSQPCNTSEIRMQAGNDPLFSGGINHIMHCYNQGQWGGNILFNKPLNITSAGKGVTLLSAERDIEAQVDAPFVFTYTNTTDSLRDFRMTAGRHIETHRKMTYRYSTNTNTIADIIMEAGRLNPDALLNTDAASILLCKTSETGSALTADNQLSPGFPQHPYEPYETFENEFSKGGTGNGSILLFDSLEFNYDGKGTISLYAPNGNIESDPYLHKNDVARGNISGKGYDGANLIHDAQITFNHSGTGLTEMKAIDVKLHDKLAYYGTANNNQNGAFSITAFDSILTRTIYYENTTDAGSVYITTDKYKSGTACLNREYETDKGGPGVNQGHIVLGYGADCHMLEDGLNRNDSIVFNFAGNQNTTGANVIIRAGYEGFAKNRVTGKPNAANLFKNDTDKGKGYGGNITFDFIKADMAVGNHMTGGYMEISTPNGNIWGKDSLRFNGMNGDLLVDAGLGSVEDTLRATRWSDFSDPSVYTYGNGYENMLNTSVPVNCDEEKEWRTGNIMLKGGSLDFQNGEGNATFRTREGYIDVYDAFTVSDMNGDLLKYAGMDNLSSGRKNQYGDLSERDFNYSAIANSGGVFFGADDNIMLNYGNSNFYYPSYGGNTGMGFPGGHDISRLNVLNDQNPYYYTSYEGYIDDLCAATFNVNQDGYLFYKDHAPLRANHRMYRGCTNQDCSGDAGKCVTTSNGARDLMFDFDGQGTVNSGGFAAVASNYIDLFTKFVYYGGAGKGLGIVPGMKNLHGEPVSGYGLYIKSQFNGEGENTPEKRRASCEDCSGHSNFPIGGKQGGDSSLDTYEWTYIGFHDDARIHTHNQKSLLEAPIIEFFGHAELDTETNKGGRSKITIKSDSLIFHDSVILSGTNIECLPYTTDEKRQKDMRYGVVNDKGESSKYYREYGAAISMPDRNVPVIELGYQRCIEPLKKGHDAPNFRSETGREATPVVGGDVIVAFKHGFSMPILNTVVANHARISLLSDFSDGVEKGEYWNACLRMDLLRIRNQVEFYTDPSRRTDHRGTLKMTSGDQMPSVQETGVYPRHLHLEPGSELSLSGEDSLIVIATTTVGGYGNLHENVFVRANGIIAPGFASMMEGDCQTNYSQGKMTIHNLKMEKDAVFRISISSNNKCYNEKTNTYDWCTQTDTLVVEDSLFFNGKIPLVILPETETLETGCYLFLEYGDSLGQSKEYVKNLVLTNDHYGEHYFGLDYTTPGKVYLCVMDYPQPVVQRRVELPKVDGVITNPGNGSYFVNSHHDFKFTASFIGSPLKISAWGYYSGEMRELDYTAEILGNNTYQYTIKKVTEPWVVRIGPEFSSEVSNEELADNRVWAYKKTLFVHVKDEDIVSIYNTIGVLYKKVEIPEGMSQFTLERGVYIITLKDGTVHKIVIK